MDTQEQKVSRKRVLMWGDSPTKATGFAQVLRNIAKIIYDTGKYEIDIVGVNHDGDPYDREKFPYNIYPAYSGLIQNANYQDPYGRQRFLDLLGTGNYQLVFILQDTFIVEGMGKLIEETRQALPPDIRFKWIYYFPIDAHPEKKWIDGSVLMSDFPVVYTKYGYDECLALYKDEKNELEKDQHLQQEINFKVLEGKLNVIYHGVNTKVFHPLSPEETKQARRKFWGEKHEGKFIFANINRNQPRKDMWRSLLACKKLLDRRRAKGKDDVYFYLHCQVVDTGNMNLLDISQQMKFVRGDEWAFPSAQLFSAGNGFSLEMVNQLYNACDFIFSTTLGEGWGLSTVEGMATGKPIIFPANTSLPEIIGNNERGLLYKSGSTPGEHVVLADDNSRIRPTANVDDLVDKMEYLIEHPEVSERIRQKSFEWVKELAWNGSLVGEKWKLLFEKAAELVDKERLIWEFDLGRNDTCPACNIKFKHCFHFQQKYEDLKHWTIEKGLTVPAGSVPAAKV